MRTTVALLLLSVRPAPGREVKFQKQVDPSALKQDLLHAGFAVSWVGCQFDRCKAILADSEKKDPLPVIQRYVFVDPSAARASRMEAIARLHAKMTEKKITAEEKDELLDLLTQELLER